MNILGIKSSGDITEIAIIVDGTIKLHKKWSAGMELAKNLLSEITSQLKRSGLGELENINGIICFSGPGSFTGLRIGTTVANTLAYSLNIPIVGIGGENWLGAGKKLITSGQNHKLVIPCYGTEPNISSPKK